MEKLEILVDENESGERLDKVVLANCDLTRSRIKNLIESGDIKVNGAIKKAGYIVKIEDEIKVNIKKPVPLSLEPSDIPIDIVYEDEYLAVINKTQGMVVHPASGSPNNTLVNALLNSLKTLSSINGVIRPGIVHRLDKDTSGLLVVAKCDEAHLSLQKQIAEKSAKRNYIALVDGVMKADKGVVITQIDRSKKNRTLMCVVKEGGRFSETHYNVLEKFTKYTLVEFILKTGRTHQIRVHSKFLGHTIVGDIAYGGSLKLYDKGQLLHAYKLSFTHPISGTEMEFFAPLPDYFKNVIQKLIREEK